MGSSSRAFVRGLGSLLLCATLAPGVCSQHSSKQALEEQPTACRIESIDFEDWQASQLLNSSVKLIIVPQLGGRLMQVVFDGHPYLFVNPRYKGRYFPPSDAQGKHRWFNYGGDKIWPLPEGDPDEHHWPGPLPDPLDDGDYSFKILSEASPCSIRLDGPPDPKTGLQYSREISWDSQSPQIRFHAIMKNIFDHPIQWSIQSVTQYDTNDPQNPGDYSREFCPVVALAPGESYAMDTEWLPVLMGKHLSGVAAANAFRNPAPPAAQDGGKASVSIAVDVQPQQLLEQPPAKNWLSYNGDYTGRRYSNLDQINVSNASKLRAQWVFHAPNSDSLEVTPVVVDGLMFVTSANDAYALDSQSGRMIWHYSRPVTEGLIDDASRHHNRGVGIWRSRVYLETDNAHLLCLDARSGHVLWDVPYTDGSKNYGATSAPLVVKDKVLVGTSGGDDGVRGFLAAFDAQSGKLAWRFWTIPAPGEPGSTSWPGDSYLHGCGTTWMPGTYDSELNTLYWGTSNPCPDFDGDPRPGDDLYTDSVLALDPDTGKLKWHFQFTPHDLFDYDATETAVLIDAVYKGEPRKLLAEANRNGFFYVLDRTDGKFVSAVPFVKMLNWAKGIDAQGRPIRTDVEPTAKGTRVCPGFSGATNWYAPSYNPETKLFYFFALEHCDVYFKKAEKFQEGQAYYSTGVKHSPGDDRKRILLAYDLESDKPVWRYPQVGNGHGFAGTMTTKGGLVFFGDDAQSFEAVDARTGAALWHFNTGQNPHASPMSYAVNGAQYVAIAAGSDIFSFALP